MLPKNFAARKLSLIVLLFLCGAASKVEAAGIPWFKDLERASEVAKKNNQPMMIEFWADWCAACKVMEAKTYSDPELVAAVSERMISVRIHFDLQQDLARKYNVPALPYLVFTNSNGTELMHHRGILEAADLTALITAFPSDVSELNRLDRVLKENTNDFESLVAMGIELRAKGFFESSNRYFGKAVNQSEAQKEPGRRELILFEMGLNFLELREAKQAERVFERCLKEFPESSNKPDFLLNLANSYVLGAQKSKARKTLETLIDGFPQSEASRKAQVIVKSL